MLTPERAIEIQCLLGSDIQMQLDECIALPAERARDRARHGAVAALGGALHARRSPAQRRQPGQALFGIVQGGIDAELRARSAEALVGDGPAGLRGRRAGGRRGRRTLMLRDARGDAADPAGRQAALPDGRRHAVRPHRSRGARHRHVRLRDADAQRAATAWPSPGTARSTCATPGTPRIPRPLDPRARCPAARDYSRAYLHHLVKSGEFLGAMLLSWANIAFYQELMAAMRAAIAEGRFAAWAETTLAARRQRYVRAGSHPAQADLRQRHCSPTDLADDVARDRSACGMTTATQHCRPRHIGSVGATSSRRLRSRWSR